MRKFVLISATAGGVGYLPGAPGTAGSVVGVGIWAALAGLGPAPAVWIGGGALLVLSIWAAGRAEAELGRRDDPRIVIDEVAGSLLALLALPLSWETALVGFALFRLFDIAKPPPCRRLERLPGGLGVVADDLMAGVYANLAGQLLWRVALSEGLG